MVRIHPGLLESISFRGPERAYRDGRVVISPVVYAELAADGHFDTTSELDRFLSDLSIQLVEPSREAGFRAGEQFQRYTRKRSDGL